ncbi:hypothetical protein FACS1894219_08180 [Clostridia bacterium]|nr:hypothetical protein FACS1894219_08180 [Clostridia bacterium]
MFNFFLKRILIVMIISLVPAFIAGGYALTVPVALVAGCVISLCKLRFWQILFGSLAVAGRKMFAVVFALLCVFTLAVMTICAILDVRLLLGFAAGYLVLPLVIMINAFTEYAHITKNNWGEKA